MHILAMKSTDKYIYKKMTNIEAAQVTAQVNLLYLFLD